MAGNPSVQQKPAAFQRIVLGWKLPNGKYSLSKTPEVHRLEQEAATEKNRIEEQNKADFQRLLDRITPNYLAPGPSSLRYNMRTRKPQVKTITEPEGCEKAPISRPTAYDKVLSRYDADISDNGDEDSLAVSNNTSHTVRQKALVQVVREQTFRDTPYQSHVIARQQQYRGIPNMEAANLLSQTRLQKETNQQMETRQKTLRSLLMGNEPVTSSTVPLPLEISQDCSSTGQPIPMQPQLSTKHPAKQDSILFKGSRVGEAGQLKFSSSASLVLTNWRPARTLRTLNNPLFKSSHMPYESPYPVPVEPATTMNRSGARSQGLSKDDSAVPKRSVFQSPR